MQAGDLLLISVVKANLERWDFALSMSDLGPFLTNKKNTIRDFFVLNRVFFVLNHDEKSRFMTAIVLAFP